MASSWLFWTPTLIWASTWHVILYQLGEVPPMDSVAYRFGLASALLLGWVAWREGRRGLRFTPGEALAVAAVGGVQYGLNYLCVYLAERHIASGLVAVMFTLMAFGNAWAGRWFFGHPTTRQHAVGAAAGVAGVALIFWPEIAAATGQSDAGWGLAFAALATLAAVAGNVGTLKVMERVRARGMGLPAVLGLSMGLGALGLAAVSLAVDGRLQWDTRPAYAASLVYLAVFGSVVAFLTYFKLAEREGPGRAGLMAIVIPVIALGVSAALEGWRPTAASWVGMALALAGLWWAIRPQATSGTLRA